jgi:hypothetical protein
VNLLLGTGSRTVNVLGTGVATGIVNGADATINVGDGTVTGIKGALHLEDPPAFDTVHISSQPDSATQTATPIRPMAFVAPR